MADELDPEAHRLMRATLAALQAMLDPLSRAHRHASTALTCGGPDIRDKISNINEAVLGLIENVNELAPAKKGHSTNNE